MGIGEIREQEPWRSSSMSCVGQQLDALIYAPLVHCCVLRLARHIMRLRPTWQYFNFAFAHSSVAVDNIAIVRPHSDWRDSDCKRECEVSPSWAPSQMKLLRTCCTCYTFCNNKLTCALNCCVSNWRPCFRDVRFWQGVSVMSCYIPRGAGK